jgi:uncharacterized protein YciI
MTEDLPLVAKDSVKIGDRWILKEPALKHHKNWLEALREEEKKVAAHIHYLNSLNKPGHLI